MALAWDTDREAVILECHDRDLDETGERAEERPGAGCRDPDGPGRPASRLARAFARRAVAVVAAGRPPCPFCGQPLDPDGHICPRANGYRR